jgi:hypothetical protein
VWYGCVSGRRQGDREPEMLRLGRHHAQQRHRIVARPCDAVADIIVEALFVALHATGCIGKERGVEPAALQRPCEALPMLELPHAVHAVVLRIGPAQRGMIDRTVHIEADQMHAFGHGVPRRSFLN